MHYYSGFADEAGADIDTQIKATLELSWTNMESRNIDGTNITDIPQDKFEEVQTKLAEAGVKIDCFGSEIANWSKDPRSDEDFANDVETMKRAISRMERLGTKMLRGMSYVMVNDQEPDAPEIEKLIFRKVSELAKMCEGAGIMYLHENCRNYGGMSHEHTLKLLDAVNSPNFKLVFDTGNPVFTDRRIGTPPHPKQSSWEFYSKVKEFVYRVHIKDSRFVEETDGIFPKSEHFFPGEGDSEVELVVSDLLKNKFNGALSIEPHLAVVFHDETKTSPDQVRYNNYVEYGRRLMAMVEKLEP